jgi:hypothetical protein
MMSWFMSGGFGMILLLLVGAGAIGYGARTLGNPTAGRIAVLRAFPALLGFLSLFSYGTGTWAVARFLEKGNFENKPAEGALTALMGFCEASQTLTLGALLAAVVVVLRMVAEAKAAKQST